MRSPDRHEWWHRKDTEDGEEVRDGTLLQFHGLFQRKAMNRQERDLAIGPKGVLRTVAVMDIPIDDEHA